MKPLPLEHPTKQGWLHCSSGRQEHVKPLRSRLCMVLTSVLFAGCANAWSERKDITSTPLLGGEPTVIESKPQPFTDVVVSRLRQRSGGKQMDWDQLASVAGRLVNKAPSVPRIRTRNSPDKLTIVDKRLFLVSIQPDILLLVPGICQ